MRAFAPVPSYAAERVRERVAGGFRFVESRNFRTVPLHAHERATLTFVLGGALEESYEAAPAGRRRGQCCSAGSVLWRPPGMVHADRFAPEGAHTAVLELDLARWELVAGLTRGLDDLVHAGGRAWEAVRLRLGHELATEDAARELELEGIALAALAALAEQRSGRPAPGEPDATGPGPAPAWLARVRELLHARFAASELRVTELAAAAGVQPVHLARVFQARLGCTPAAHVRRLRLCGLAIARPRCEPSTCRGCGSCPQTSPAERAALLRRRRNATDRGPRPSGGASLHDAVTRLCSSKRRSLRALRSFTTTPHCA